MAAAVVTESEEIIAMILDAPSDEAATKHSAMPYAEATKLRNPYVGWYRTEGTQHSSEVHVQ